MVSNAHSKIQAVIVIMQKLKMVKNHEKHCWKFVSKLIHGARKKRKTTVNSAAVAIVMGEELQKRVRHEGEIPILFGKLYVSFHSIYSSN